ncbi:uncharacterized protein LOC128732552 [Sabethes cyaneus]|uniref:uncharacterized protein LOC128732552 n=1 Tax=Sabethes cyaneus TaxID=53552 RepID=UPI00237E18F2|nr:uncharacterized protein LOC128732552 [Sabethes cyaneus]
MDELIQIKQEECEIIDDMDPLENTEHPEKVAIPIYKVEPVIKTEQISTSRHKRTTDRGSVDLTTVVQAIRAIKSGQIRLRAGARFYHLPRTTLQRHMDNVALKYDDISNVSDEQLLETIKRVGTYAACAVKRVFSVEEEEAFIIYTKQFHDSGNELSIGDFRRLAYQFARKLKVNYPSSWNEKEMSGRDWYYGFMRRHPQLVLRPSEEPSPNKMESSCKEENV